MPRLSLLALFACIAPALVALPARADDCSGSSVTHVQERAPRHWIELRPQNDGPWQIRVRTPGAEGEWAPLTALRRHAHTIVAVPAGKRFAIIDAAGDHDEADRVLVLETDGRTVKVVRTYGLAELLTPAELAAVGRSISHIDWLAPRAGDPPPVRLAGVPGVIMIDVVGGRTLRLGL